MADVEQAAQGCDGIVHLACRLALDGGATGEDINVGTGVMITLMELAKLIIEISGARMSPRVEKTDVRPMRIQADMRKARRMLGFEAEVSLSEGLSRMLKVERSQRGLEVT